MNAKTLDYVHYPGGSCACVAWSGVFRKHGYNFSEADIFGLGSGIFFGYCAIASTKVFDLCLTSSSIVDDLLINTGVNGKMFQYSNGEICLDKIINSLDSGYPVAVQLNPYFCDGLIKITPIDLQKYLPAHWIIITGYDLASKTFFTYDNRQFNHVAIPFDKFVTGRNTGLNDQNPRNFFYTVYFYENLYPMEFSVKISLRKACVNFQNVDKIQSFFTGNYGLEKFTRQIAIWDKMIKPEDLPALLQKIKLSITGAGGIKGGYRFLFSTYLKTAAKVLNENDLLTSSALFKESASNWNMLADELTDGSLHPSDKYFWGEKSRFAGILKDIRKNESQGFDIIKRIIK
jgi:hypothetical protein